MKYKKSVSAHVFANKNCSVCRMMILLVSAHAYKPKQLKQESTNLFSIVMASQKILST